ncbi:MAG: alkaline phosphatase family protein [Myxococcota bacterium]
MKYLALALLLTSATSAWAQSAHDPIPLDQITAPRGGGKRAPKAPGKVVAPKLVVVMVADQFRAEFLTRFSKNFGPKGFRRLLQDGAVFTGRYEQQNTYTGPGHATLASGSWAYVNGIAQNRFYNYGSKRGESMLFDADAKLLSGETGPDDETSPKNFFGSTLGDEMRLQNPRAKAIGVALKDRGAILLGGRTGVAYFQSEATGEMTTSTYYLSAVPAWVSAFNAEKRADKAFGKTWDRLYAVDKYQAIDDKKWESEGKGLGRTFPHVIDGKLKAPGPDYYTMFQHTPFGLELGFDFAKAALEGEALGKRGVTDFLGVSITPTDLVGHAYGPYSQEAEDMVYRVDQAIAGFLGELDKRFQPGEVLVVFTADHGASAIPEESKESHLEATRLKKAAIKDAITKALNARYFEGEWVVGLEDPSIYLNRALMAEKKLNPSEVQAVAAEAVLGLPGVAQAFTRTQLLNGWLPPVEKAQWVARSYYPPRGGDVVILQAPFSFWGKYAEKDAGSTHGSPYRYDTDVPLIFLGAPFAPGLYGQARQIDLAPTLASVLGVNEPAGCEGRVLVEALR